MGEREKKGEPIAQRRGKKGKREKETVVALVYYYMDSESIEAGRELLSLSEEGRNNRE